MGSNINVMQSLADFKQSLQQSHPATAGATDSTTTSSSTSDTTTITANDFLQLLVAEMKNQDPTADQDPNAYIDQLVQVNSLQQLIAINQDLSGGTSSSGGTSEAASARMGASPAAGTSANSTAGSVPSVVHRLGQQSISHSRRELGTAAGTSAARVATAFVPRPGLLQQVPAQHVSLSSVSDQTSTGSPGVVASPTEVSTAARGPAILRWLSFLRP